VGSFTPRPLYPEVKSPWYPSDMRLSGPQSQSGGVVQEGRVEKCCNSTQPVSWLYRIWYDIYPLASFVNHCMSCMTLVVPVSVTR